MRQEQSGSHGKAPRAHGPAARVGSERLEPGQPTRKVDHDGVPDSDVEAIARQQGATQRGYTADGDDDEDRPAQFDPAHPGGKPAGDPRR